MSNSPSEPESQALNLAALTARVERLEMKLNQVLLLLTDIYRYEKLQNLLVAGRWREADEETTRIMLEIAGKNSLENLTPDEVMLFPCNALQLLDRLWLNASDGRFGFSIQQQIYLQLGGTDDIADIDLTILRGLAEQAGWYANDRLLDYDELDFSISAPRGCHPSGWWRSPYGAKMAVYFIARLIRCNI